MKRSLHLHDREARHARQVQGRVRRLRHLRPSRSGQPHLPRALCAAASRPGERRHRHGRRHADAHLARDGPRHGRLRRATRSRRSPGTSRSATPAIRRPARAGSRTRSRSSSTARTGRSPIAHNGNLVNARELRDELVRDGSIFQTEQRHRGHAPPLRAVARARASRTRSSSRSRRCSGAFSFVLLTKDRLIAARDPHGFRPLALGRLGDAYIVCSETCALDLIGATYVRDVEPGEVLIISDGGLRSLQAVPAGAAGALRLRARVLRAARQLRVRPERQRGAHRARAHARATSRAVDADVVVPDSRLGRLRRDRLRRGIGHADGDGADPQPLRRPHVHPAAAVDPALRRAVKLNPVRSILEGRRVVLVDDSIVRGTTSRKIVKMVRAAGAQGSAHADQLPADDLAVLLRRRYAATGRS